MTITELYNLAKTYSIEDLPIFVNHYCNDGWYSLINEELTEKNIDSKDGKVYFVFKEERYKNVF